MNQEMALAERGEVKAPAPARPPGRARRWRWREAVGRLGLPVVLLAYLAAGLYWLPAYRYQINPDGVGYLAVAQKYLRGEYFDAINAYWSPFYSWLVVPLLAAGVTPLLAIKIVEVGIGAAGLAIVWRLLGHLEVSRDLRVLACAGLIPMLLWFGLHVTTPDLLVAVALLGYLTYALRPDFLERKRHAVVAGLLGGLAYLAKAYALPVVAGHLVLMMGIELVRNWHLRGRVLAMGGLALLGLLVVVGVWSGVLTHKYGHFTTGSTGRFNHAINAPQPPGFPMHTDGLLPPPNATAHSAWEDATYFDLPRWNPLGSEQEWAHQKVLLSRNYDNVLKFNQQYTWLFYPILIAIVLLAGWRMDPRPRKPALLLLLAWAIYPAGYLLLHVEKRFLDLMAILLVVFAAFVVGAAARGGLLDGVGRWLVMGVVAWSFITPAWQELDKRRDPGKALAENAARLEGLMPARARTASVGRWGEGMYYAFYLDSSYYGTVRQAADASAVLEQLREHLIEYFWVFGDQRYQFLAEWEEITGEAVGGLRIYRVGQPEALE